MTRQARQPTRKPAAASSAASLPLDITALGIIRDRLLKARLELQEAYLHAQGHPEAASMVAAAGKPLRTALDAFEAAYARGRL